MFAVRLPCLYLLFCPLSPRPRSQSALPQRGRGSPKVYFAGGFAPGTPALDRSRHLQPLPSGHPGAEPARHWLSLPLWRPAGWRRGRSPANPAFSFPFAPYPPAPARRALFPGGEGGESKFSYARGSAPCILGACSARHWLGGRQRCPAGAHRGWSSARPAPPCSRRGRAFLLACQPCF